jgi:hypothetical protein
MVIKHKSELPYRLVRGYRHGDVIAFQAMFAGTRRGEESIVAVVKFGAAFAEPPEQSWNFPLRSHQNKLIVGLPFHRYIPIAREYLLSSDLRQN